MVCPLEVIFTRGSLRMFLYHCELVPITGSSNNSVALSTNQTGRGIGFLLLLPVTVSSISFCFVNLDLRLSAFISGSLVERVSGMKKVPWSARILIVGMGAERLRVTS